MIRAVIGCVVYKVSLTPTAETSSCHLPANRNQCNSLSWRWLQSLHLLPLVLPYTVKMNGSFQPTVGCLSCTFISKWCQFVTTLVPAGHIWLEHTVCLACQVVNALLGVYIIPLKCRTPCWWGRHSVMPTSCALIYIKAERESGKWPVFSDACKCNIYIHLDTFWVYKVDKHFDVM